MIMSDNEVAVDIEEDVQVNTQPPARKSTELGMDSSSGEMKI